MPPQVFGENIDDFRDKLLEALRDPAVVAELHNYSDVLDPTGQHHVLGVRHDEASYGDHTHNSQDSHSVSQLIAVNGSKVTWDGTELLLGTGGHGVGTAITKIYVTGPSPVFVTGEGITGASLTAPDGSLQPSLGQWFDGLGIQTIITTGTGRQPVFAIRNNDGGGQPIIEIDSYGNVLIGRNDNPNNQFPVAITSGGIGSALPGSKGGLTSSSGAITGGPYPTLGTWYSGVGINMVSAGGTGSNAFGIVDNTGGIMYNITDGMVIQMSSRGSDAGAPMRAGAGSLYVLNGALRYRGGGGTLTTVAPN